MPGREARKPVERSCALVKLAVAAVSMSVLTAGGGQGTGAPREGRAARRDPLPGSAVSPTLTPQVSGTTRRLDSVSVVNENVVWASGRNGTVVRTLDGGETWEVHVIPGAETLAFRDIEAFSKDVAFVIANCDSIAHADRTLKQQNKAGRNVSCEVLQTKTNTNGEGGENNCD